MAKKKTNKDKLVSATYLIPKGVKDQIEEQAVEEGGSAGQIVRRVLKKWFGGGAESETISETR